jgi:hypothetical protein
VKAQRAEVVSKNDLFLWRALRIPYIASRETSVWLKPWIVKSFFRQLKQMAMQLKQMTIEVLPQSH